MLCYYIKIFDPDSNIKRHRYSVGKFESVVESFKILEIKIVLIKDETLMTLLRNRYYQWDYNEDSNR